jgi:hypothetical protein
VGVFDEDLNLFVKNGATSSISTTAILEIISTDGVARLKLGTSRFFDLTEKPSYKTGYDTERYAVVTVGEDVGLDQAIDGAPYIARCYTFDGSGTVDVEGVTINCDEWNLTP